MVNLKHLQWTWWRSCRSSGKWKLREGRAWRTGRLLSTSQLSPPLASFSSSSSFWSSKSQFSHFLSISPSSSSKSPFSPIYYPICLPHPHCFVADRKAENTCPMLGVQLTPKIVLNLTSCPFDFRTCFWHVKPVSAHSDNTKPGSGPFHQQPRLTSAMSPSLGDLASAAMGWVRLSFKDLVSAFH